MNRNIPVNLPEGYVEFYTELESWQNEQEIKLRKTYFTENNKVSKLIGSNNICMMQKHNFYIDPSQFKNNYIALIDLLKIHRRNITEVLEQLLKTADQLDFEKLSGVLLEDNQGYLQELAEDLGVSEEVFIFTLDHSIRPFLRLFAQPLYEDFMQIDSSEWNQPAVCPFCGSKSHFSRLRMDDGKRFMFCDRCFTEWGVPNLYCVYCANDEPKTISYLSIENDGSYQVYICDKCKGYLKTYDEREDGKTVDLFIADIETLYLDILAQEKGYIKHDYY